MKQRVIVQIRIRRDDTLLLLRRAQGKPSLVGKYELPGGRLETQEQPEEAVKRHVKNDTTLMLEKISLIDALAFTSPEDGNAQNILLIYEGWTNDSAIVLGRSYDEYAWQPMNLLQQLELRDSTKVIFAGMSNQLLTDSKGINKHKHDVKEATNTKHFIIYTDGGSRGNPGPSSAGYVIMSKDTTIIDQGGRYLGVTTNNQAEYEGVHLALERALVLGAEIIEFRLDSMLVVNQMKGIYKIKNRELWPINELIRRLVKNFKKVTFTHVPRELNQQADTVVNVILDKHQFDQT